MYLLIAEDELTYPDYWAIILSENPGNYVTQYLMKSQDIWIFDKRDGKSPKYSIICIVYNFNEMDCFFSFSLKN